MPSPKQPVPADPAYQACGPVEEVNRAVLVHPEVMTAPRIQDTVRALMSLTERLPQTFEQLAGVLEIRAREGVIRMDSQLAKPAAALFSMGHRDADPA